VSHNPNFVKKKPSLLRDEYGKRYVDFLSAFAELQKATTRFVIYAIMSVCAHVRLSIRTEKYDS
jgi:hypothetical protein